jgi:hypothetical protein
LFGWLADKRGHHHYYWCTTAGTGGSNAELAAVEAAAHTINELFQIFK